MPRSNAAPSDHSSDRRRDSLHPDFPEQDITASECGTEPDSDPESLSEGHPGVLEYQNILLQEVCWFHRSAAIYLEAPDRRTSGARIAAMRMQQHNMDADDILRIALPQLEPEPSGSLQRDYQYMATALRRQLPRNGRQWIRSTVMREELLTRQQVSQALCLLLVQEFMAHLADATMAKARHFARLAVDVAKPLLYQPMLLAVWPLLSGMAQGRMQRWYLQYEQHRQLHPTMPEFYVDPNLIDDVLPQPSATEIDHENAMLQEPSSSSSGLPRSSEPSSSTGLPRTSEPSSSSGFQRP